MSVGAVFGARDGLLVIVDGLKSDVDKSSHNDLRTLELKQRKYAISPVSPAVVVLTGQASLAGFDAWQWAEDSLSPDSNHGVAPTDPREIARGVVRGLETVIAKDAVNRRNQSLRAGIGVQGFIAAATERASPGSVPGEVWTFAIDGRLNTTEPSIVSGFSDPGSPWPLEVVPARPLFGSPDDHHGRLPADAILERFNDHLDEFRNSQLSAVREHVETKMVALVGAESDTLRRHGVGGCWSVIELRSGARPEPEFRWWGPAASPSTRS